MLNPQNTQKAIIIVDALHDIVFTCPEEFSREKFLRQIIYTSSDGIDRVSVEYYKNLQMIVCRFRVLDSDSVRVTRHCRRISDYSEAEFKLSHEAKKTLRRRQSLREAAAKQVSFMFN